MKDCICGEKPTHEDNTPGSLYMGKSHTLKHRVSCSCGITTKFYDTPEMAETAWENKGWVNKRRVA